MTVLVVDASIAMARCYADGSIAYTQSLLFRVRRETAVVPIEWPLEVVNGLLVGERRNRLTRSGTTRFVQLVQALPIRIDDPGLAGVWGQTLALGREHNLSSYDASYLELALRANLPLATLDRRLRRVAAASGVVLLTKD